MFGVQTYHGETQYSKPEIKRTLNDRLKDDLCCVPGIYQDLKVWIKFLEYTNRFEYKHSFDIYKSKDIVKKLPYNYMEVFFKDIETVQYSKISTIFIDMKDQGEFPCMRFCFLFLLMFILFFNGMIIYKLWKEWFGIFMWGIGGLLLIAFISWVIFRCLRLYIGPSFDQKCLKRAEDIKEKIKQYNRKHESEGFIFGSTKQCMGISIGMIPPNQDQIELVPADPNSSDLKTGQVLPMQQNMPIIPVSGKGFNYPSYLGKEHIDFTVNDIELNDELHDNIVDAN